MGHTRGRNLPLAFLKQPFQRFHTTGLKAGAIIKGELTQSVVQFGRESEQHPFRSQYHSAPRIMSVQFGASSLQSLLTTPSRQRC